MNVGRPTNRKERRAEMTSWLEDMFYQFNIKDPPVLEAFDIKTRCLGSVCHVEEGKGVIIQVLENPNGFGSLDEMFIEDTGGREMPGLFDQVEMLSFRGCDCEGREMVERFRVVEKAPVKNQSECILVVSKVLSETMVEVVGTGFATPQPTHVARDKKLEEHKLVHARKYEMPRFFRTIRKDKKIMYKKDIELAKKYDEVMAKRKKDKRIQIPAVATAFVLEDVRILTKEERKTVKEWARNIEGQLTEEEANLYIRDPHVASGRLEEYIQKEQALAYKITKKVAFDKHNQKMTIELTKEETKRLIDKKNMSSWRVNDEMQLVHPDLAKFDRGKGISVVIIWIKRLDDGGSKVTFRTTQLSDDVMCIVRRTNTDLNNGKDSTIGPQEDTPYSVAEIVEKRFDSWFKHPLFTEWCGRSTMCIYKNFWDSDEEEEDEEENEDEPFLVRGSPLDEFQLHAMRTASKKRGFTTISAPPGSGKTHLISAIVENGGNTRFAISANSNNAVDNAVDAIKRNFPSVTVCRDFSKKSSYSAHPATLKYSLRKMSENAGNYVDLSFYKKLRKTMQAKRNVQKNLRKNVSDMKDGFSKLHRLRALEKEESKEFLKAYGPIVLASTSVLLSRQMISATHLIIDEAAMMAPLHALALYCQLPLLKRVTLLGDSRQKKPFSLAKEDSMVFKLGMKGELSRLEGIETATHTQLRIVYRFHPMIVKNILNPIYDHTLTSGVTAADRNLAESKELVATNDGTPVHFWNLRGSNGANGFNEREAELTIGLLRALKDFEIEEKDIAVLCHHKAQLEKMFIRAKKEFGDFHKIDLQTVDSYQGKESKVVILLMTKTCGYGNPSRAFSFVSEPHRETVAVSRAQDLMFLIGDWDALFKTPFWSQFAVFAKDHEALYDFE